MDDKSLNLPENRNYEYSLNQSYQLAVDRLVNMEDFEVLCLKSGSLCQWVESRKNIILSFLNRMYRVTTPEVTISIIDSDEEVPLREKVLILHYILNARGTLLSNTPITFKELPEGPVYFRTFNQRTIKHLVSSFSSDPQNLFAASKSFGGRKAAYGDAAVTIEAFLRVPITLVVFKGDDEFPAEGNILYDSTIPDYLPTEDIIVLTETLIWRLVRSIKA